MTAPNKHGLNYFPHDVDMSNDQKIEYLEAECGLLGYAIFCKILERIYRVGYYLYWHDRDSKLFARRNNIETECCINTIKCIINEGLCNRMLHEKYSVLTSKSIQKRYIEANKRRKNIKIYKEFLLHDQKELLQAYPTIVFVTLTPPNVTLTPTNVTKCNINPQKCEQTKLKETKLKDIKSQQKYCDKSEEVKLSKLLFKLIKKRDPKYKKPNFQNWAVHIDRLNRLEKRSYKDIEKVIRWCQNNSEPNDNGFCWANNILSTKKLREQFGQLWLKMSQPKEKTFDELADEHLKKAGLL